jgi:cell wall-associated NlpC family hydrolase
MRSSRKPIAAVGCLLAAGAIAGCGTGAMSSNGGTSARSSGSTSKAPAKAGPSSEVAAAAVLGTGPAASSRGSVREVADPQEAASFPAPATVHHAAAATPAKAGEAIVAAGAPSDAEVRRELQQMQAAERTAKQAQQRQLTAVPGGQSIGGNGTLAIPATVPEVVQKVIAGANEIADFPYVFGGGHASFVDNSYDCSGSVSYALAAGGLLSSPETSGDLESWGAPGPGKYITVLANAGHTYMYVDGMLYDTAGRSGVYASRWQVGSVNNAGFVVRHWPGL